MLLGSTFEIGTQIILSKIDGFLKGWILNITPLKGFAVPQTSFLVGTFFSVSYSKLVLGKLKNTKPIFVITTYSLNK